MVWWYDFGCNIIAHSMNDASWGTGWGALWWQASNREVTPNSASNPSNYGNLEVDFSLVNSIYGRTDIVQPNAYKIVAWRRTA